MKKIGYVFPGQGAQYIGMGKDLYEKNETAKEVFALASKVTGMDVESLCFEENENLNQTKYTQIAMVATEVAILQCMEKAGLKPDVTAGLSLGEYAAVVASGAMKMEDAFALVLKRGLWMQEAYPTGGAMAAILGSDAKVIEEVCESIDGAVSIANYNCPGQIVITGEEGAVTTACEKLKDAGAKRCVPLQVSGPFHSPFMKKAADSLKEMMENIELAPIEIPYICNVEAEYVTDSSKIKGLLEQQVCASVRFMQTVEKMLADGVTTFVEVGPGKTLQGFIKKVSKEAEVFHVETAEELEAFVAYMKAE